jgi:hypothetical protein
MKPLLPDAGICRSPNQTPRLQSSSLNQKFSQRYRSGTCNCSWEKRRTGTSLRLSGLDLTRSPKAVTPRLMNIRETRPSKYSLSSVQGIRVTRTLRMVPTIREVARFDFTRECRRWSQRLMMNPKVKALSPHHRISGCCLRDAMDCSETRTAAMTTTDHQHPETPETDPNPSAPDAR